MAGNKSLKRAFDVLNLYSAGGAGLGVSEIAQKLKINKPTASRLMTTLESINIVRRNLKNRKYSLAGEFVRLARACLKNLDLKTISMPHLEELSRKTQEAVRIHIVDGDERFCLAWVDSPKPVRFVMDEKSIHGPLHAGAPGKLLLAFLPEREMLELIERTGLPRYTELTITSKKDLLKEMETIRKQGFAMSRGEHIESLNTVSAPVHNYLGKVIAALSINWVKGRNDTELRGKYIILVKETAGQISDELGYTGEA